MERQRKEAVRHADKRLAAKRQRIEKYLCEAEKKVKEIKSARRKNREERAAVEQFIALSFCARQMAHNEAVEHNIQATKLEAKCQRRSQQTDIINSIAQQRVKKALRTGNKPPRILTYITAGGTTVLPPPVRGLKVIEVLPATPQMTFSAHMSSKEANV